MYPKCKRESSCLDRSGLRMSHTFQFLQGIEFLRHRCLRCKSCQFHLDRRIRHNQNIFRLFPKFSCFHIRLVCSFYQLHLDRNTLNILNIYLQSQEFGFGCHRYLECTQGFQHLGRKIENNLHIFRFSIRSRKSLSTKQSH